MVVAQEFQRIEDLSEDQRQEMIHDNEFDKLHKGMVILVDNPVRIIRVDKIGSITERVSDSGGRRAVQLPAAFVTSTIPSVPIEGIVDPSMAAKGGQLARQSSVGGDKIQWEEVWSTRLVGRKLMPKGAPAKVVGGHGGDLEVTQLYCKFQIGRELGEMQSSVAGRPISGTIVPEELHPRGQFKTEAQRAADAATERSLAQARDDQKAKAEYEKEIEMQVEVARRVKGLGEPIAEPVVPEESTTALATAEQRIAELEAKLAAKPKAKKQKKAKRKYTKKPKVVETPPAEVAPPEEVAEPTVE